MLSVILSFNLLRLFLELQNLSGHSFFLSLGGPESILTLNLDHCDIFLEIKMNHNITWVLMEGGNLNLAHCDLFIESKRIAS